MEIQGYVLLHKSLDADKAMGDPKDWAGNIVRVIEFNDNSKSILCIDNSATKMAMFDYDEIHLSFRCELFANVILPPGLASIEKTQEYVKRIQRKGGYNEVVKKMVIASSLSNKKFNDDFLFQKQ